MEAKPKDLYIFRDHWREDRADEQTKCEQVISVVKELIDNTGINVQYLLPETNLGCGAGPMTGISWFFENVEQGIVMEDDCLAHPDFFPYCEELLNRYKGTDVKFINSTLYDDRWSRAMNVERLTKSDSYGFSRYMCTGAWASYREVWQGFDLDLNDMSAIKFAWRVFHITHNLAEAEWWWYQVRAIQQDKSKKSYWDYQMQIHLFRQNAMTIHPAVNLISNIGFDPEGTHTLFNDGRGDKDVYPIMPLRHPEVIGTDWKRDMRCWAKKSSRGVLKDCLLLIYHMWTWRKKVVK